MYVLDTNVLSELRRNRPHGAVLDWIGKVATSDLYVAAVTLGELQAGVEMTRGQDPGKADEIEAWMQMMEETLTILPMDGAAFRLWAKLMHRRNVDLREDAMIAAVALTHDFAVVTRNVRDFEGFGVTTVDPFRGATAT